MKSRRTSLHLAVVAIALMAASAQAAQASPDIPSTQLQAPIASVDRYEATAVALQVGDRQARVKLQHPLLLQDPGTRSIVVPWPTQSGLCTSDPRYRLDPVGPLRT